MRRKRSDFDGSRHGEAAERAAVFLPPLLREISDAASALETKAARIFSDQARELLAHAGSPRQEVRLFRVTLDEHIPMSVLDDVWWLLANTDEANSATAAIETAVRHSMMAEIEAGLSHRFAAVVARAQGGNDAHDRAVARSCAGPR